MAVRSKHRTGMEKVERCMYTVLGSSRIHDGRRVGM